MLAQAKPAQGKEFRPVAPKFRPAHDQTKPTLNLCKNCLARILDPPSKHGQKHQRACHRHPNDFAGSHPGTPQQMEKRAQAPVPPRILKASTFQAKQHLGSKRHRTGKRPTRAERWVQRTHSLVDGWILKRQKNRLKRITLFFVRPARVARLLGWLRF